MKGILTMMLSMMIVVGTSVNAQSPEIEKLKEKKEKYDKQAKELKEQGKRYDKMSSEQKAEYDARKVEIEAFQKQVMERKEEIMEMKGEKKHKGLEDGADGQVEKANEKPGNGESASTNERSENSERPGVESRPERPASETSETIAERPSNKEVLEAKERWEKESKEREVKIKERTSQTQERISAIDSKIELAKRRLGAKRAKNEISEEEYQLKLGRVDRIEAKLKSLRERNAEKATLMEQVKTDSDAPLKK